MSEAVPVVVEPLICRRDGHVPSAIIHKSTTALVTSYVTTCLRCGKAFTVTVPK